MVLWFLHGLTIIDILKLKLLFSSYNQTIL